MRVALAIFALIGLTAIGLVIFIGTGLLHLSSLDRLAATSGVNSATSQPATGPDDSDDPVAAEPDSVEAMQPPIVDRSVFLSAADATLTGPKIALMARDNVVLKTGDDEPPPALPDFPVFGRGFRDGRRRRPAPAPFLARWATPEDCAQWDFQSPADGTYTVSFVYSGPPNRLDKPGGPFVLSIGTGQIIVSLKPTTNGGSFELADVGEVHLPKGQVHLTVRPEGKITYETSIRLRSVRLFPAQP